MHSIPVKASNLKVGDYFVIDPDTYFFAVRWKVTSKTDTRIDFEKVFRYKDDAERASEYPTYNKSYFNLPHDDVYMEDAVWSAFKPHPDKELNPNL